MSRDGRIARDTMLGLMKTCRKLRLSFWQYLGDRLGIDGRAIPPLAALVTAKAYRHTALGCPSPNAISLTMFALASSNPSRLTAFVLPSAFSAVGFIGACAPDDTVTSQRFEHNATRPPICPGCKL
ncbi:hypothetical protein [Ensifer adhaerens]|uniref:hypothetical protein n=1 Tax=Ensifer adhaerens TaxID=106592 RepID=UPI00069D262A|nr:hypothetical protein [Ensifer adhaerens]